MKNISRLAILSGALSLLSACQPPADTKVQQLAEQPAADSACVDCKWENFLARPMRVERIECTNQGKPEHCHLTTEKGEPRREVTVTFQQGTGAYDWTLLTPDKPNDRMECPNLAPDIDNPRVIQGTCIIYDSDHGPAVHFFRATIRPKDEDPTKGGVVGEFRHTPFVSGAKEPVHDGHIHTN